MELYKYRVLKRFLKQYQAMTFQSPILRDACAAQTPEVHVKVDGLKKAASGLTFHAML